MLIAVVGMAASGAFLWLTQRDIPIGTAYAVWTGIGAAGTFAVGIAFYGDSASAWRLVSVHRRDHRPETGPWPWLNAAHPRLSATINC